MHNIHQKQNTLLFSLLGRELFGTQTALDTDGVDFAALFDEARKQAVAPQVFQALPETVAVEQPAVYADWMGFAMRAISQNARITYAHRQLAQVLEPLGVPYCILKGVTSASYYADPGCRVMGDVDFLIPPSAVEQTVAALEQAGYKKLPDAEDHHFHIAFGKDKVLYELHYRFSESENPAEEDDGLTDRLLEQAVDLELPDGMGTVRSACPAHHGLIMLLHMKRHMTSSGMGLRHLCDWAVFVEKFESETFEREFKALFDSYGLWRFAQVLGQVCHRYLGCASKAWFGEAEEDLCADLMEYIFSTGNFGSKGTGFADLFIRNTDVGSTNRLVQLTVSVKRIVIGHWPRAAKNPLLLTVGFVYFPARYAVNSLLGRRRKVNPLQMLRAGKAANDTFGRLDLYTNSKEKNR